MAAVVPVFWRNGTYLKGRGSGGVRKWGQPPFPSKWGLPPLCVRVEQAQCRHWSGFAHVGLRVAAVAAGDSRNIGPRLARETLRDARVHEVEALGGEHF